MFDEIMTCKLHLRNMQLMVVRKLKTSLNEFAYIYFHLEPTNERTKTMWVVSDGVFTFPYGHMVDKMENKVARSIEMQTAVINR